MANHLAINLQDIEATIACQDPVLRNLQITQTYCELNGALSELVGRKNVSWCAYGTWASKTAGKFIRKDSIDAAIAEFLRDNGWVEELRSVLPGALTWFGWKVNIRHSFLVKTLNETAEAASHEVAEGNLLVFAELAPLYANFIRIAGGSGQYRQEVLDEFLTFLSNLDREDQRKEKLERAYTAYYQAMFENDPKAKAELILLANLLVGYHEQIRLDKAIDNSINAPIDQVFRKKLLGGLAHWIEGTMPRWVFQVLSWYVKYRVEPVIDRMAEKWRAISTELLMRIEVPGGHLDLSEDLPLMPYNARRMFPPDLETIDHPELRQILQELDFTPDSTAGSGARDWSRLSDRMNFIADFFRSEQQDERLYRPPFTAEQTLAIKNGQVPGGKL